MSTFSNIPLKWIEYVDFCNNYFVFLNRKPIPLGKNEGLYIQNEKTGEVVIEITVDSEFLDYK